MSRDASSSLVDCEFCGSAVPIMNLQVHQAHECPVTREIVDMYSGSGERNESPVTPALVATSFPVIDFATSQFDDAEADVSWWTTTDQRESNVARAVSTGEEEDDRKQSSRAHQPAVIDLYDFNDYDIDEIEQNDDDCVVVSPVVSPTEPTSHSDHWTCFNCTLENEQWRSHCAACELERVTPNESAYVADSTQRDRLVDDDDYMAMFSLDPSSSVPSLSGVAEAVRRGLPFPLPGTVSDDMHTFLGAPLAAVRGPSVDARGVARVVNPYRSRPNHRRRSAARAAAAFSDGPSPPRRRRRHNGEEEEDDGINDNLMQYMMQQALASLHLQHGSTIGLHRQHAHQHNIDNMSYEQLLTAFGDGSDEMGGSETDIHNLPVVKLNDPNTELPSDCRQCNICLEDFESGDLRKTLPCLHGFHAQCADTWLRSNGSCPVCKTKIGDS